LMENEIEKYILTSVLIANKYEDVFLIDID